MFLHEVTLTNAAKDKSNVNEKDKNQDDKTQCNESEIIDAFQIDSKEHFNVNRDCGLNNESQKCKRCKFVTHSMGTLRMHEKHKHSVYNPFEKIIDGFKFDDQKYYEFLSAMFEGDELNKKKCRKCSFKTHSVGFLKIHETKSH